MSGLDQFRDTYIAECLELLEQMEEDLLGLDEAASREQLDSIFRCAHSIKGGAGAFGFTVIAQFTHTLEALLDKLREGELSVTRELTDLLLQSRDVLLKMVVAARDGETLEKGFGESLAEALKAAGETDGGSGVESKAAAASAAAAPEAETSESAEEEFLIKFMPLPTLMATGNEPLLLIRELRRLGESSVRCDLSKLPPLAQVEPDICYFSWEITLRTERGESAIREVFEFVEDECVLEISHRERTQVSPSDGAKTDEALPLETSAKEANAQQSKEESKKPQAPVAASAAQTGSVSTASIRVDIDKVDRLINMVGEIVITQAMLAMQSRYLPVQEYPEMVRGIEELTQHTRELQEAVMAVRMQPVKSIFSRMPRIVRDLSAQLGKDIRLEMNGESTEVDKTIIEQLSDPLTHMIRNSVDHGVESPAVRKENGKDPQGRILLSAEHRGGKIVITVSDDGAGINRERVLKKSREKGIVPADAQLTDNEIDMLIFAPGFSTAETVTNVSGRGVGMDVVKRNIEGIGGTVQVHNTPGSGSNFIISLPLTLAILDGMVVRVASEHYIVPIANIIETMRPKTEEVKSVADGSTVINVRGHFVPVLYLHQLFTIREAETDASKALVVLVENGDTTLGLVVDELVGQQQVVIKSLEENSDPIEGVSGATILGDGKVSLILDIPGLCNIRQRRGEIRRAA